MSLLEGFFKGSGHDLVLRGTCCREKFFMALVSNSTVDTMLGCGGGRGDVDGVGEDEAEESKTKLVSAVDRGFV